MSLTLNWPGQHYSPSGLKTIQKRAEELGVPLEVVYNTGSVQPKLLDNEGREIAPDAMKVLKAIEGLGRKTAYARIALQAQGSPSPSTNN